MRNRLVATGIGVVALSLGLALPAAASVPPTEPPSTDAPTTTVETSEPTTTVETSEPTTTVETSEPTTTVETSEPTTTASATTAPGPGQLPPAVRPPVPGQTPGQELPATGSSGLSLGAIALALVLLGSGAGLIAATRRRA